MDVACASKIVQYTKSQLIPKEMAGNRKKNHGIHVLSHTKGKLSTNQDVTRKYLLKYLRHTIHFND